MKINIFFIGNVTISKTILNELLRINNVSVKLVLTKSKSSYNSDHSDIFEFSKKKNIETLCFFKTNIKEIKKKIKMHNINLGICVGWSETIPNEIINNIELGCIGFHPTMLPKNRGKHPIIWSIFLGLKYTGSTFFLMNQNIDSGEILDQKLIKISKYENSQSLYSKIQTKAVFQIKKVLIDLKKKRFNTFKQSNNLANYWRKRKEIDGHIDWRMNFVTIDRLVRSLHKPYPGAFYIYKNNKIPVWKIKKSPKKNTSNIEPGKVITNNNDDVMVKCYDCFLWIIEHDFKEIPKSGEYLL